MKTMFAVLAVGSLVIVGATGCDQSSSSGTKTGAAGVMDKAHEAATKTVEGAKDAAKGALDSAKETAAKAGDAAHGAIETLKAEGNKWLTDTVNKQWPAAKEAVANFEKSLPAIKDATIKAKVESAVKELKDQIPSMEGLVAQLQNFKEGDYSALLTKAKDAFAAFMKKVDEVKAMIPH